MTLESKVKSQIRKYLQDRGWYIRSIASNYYALKDGIVLFIEVKSPNGTLSDKQIETRREILDHGGNYILAYGVDDIKAFFMIKGIK